MSLTVRAFAGLGFLLAVLGAALFVPAGTIDYWQAWLFLGVFATAVFAITIDLMLHDAALLARRVQAGPTAERTRIQRLIQSVASIAFLALFVLSALDHRWGWSHLPSALAIAGDGLVALGLFVVFRVFRANTFTSATIEIARDQQVVSSGPYAIVRHPMYAGAFVMLLGVPIALGSFWALLSLPALVVAIVWRLFDEEKQLSRELAGYEAYRARVKHRLVPWLW